MTDRPEHRGRPSGGSVPPPAPAGEPAVIIVPYRPGRVSAKLLPPILLVLLGAAFLTYRARSPDWRGVSALFEARSAPTPAPAASLARAEEPRARVDEPPARVVEPTPTVPKADPAGAVEARGQKGATAQEAEKEKEKGAKLAGPRAEEDPLEDIRREAEKTRERRAELEQLKEREARKLDETAEERLQADRHDRRFNPGFRVGRVPPEQVEKMLRAQGEQLRRRMEQMAAMQRRRMEQMAALQRGFFNDREPMFAPPPPPPLPRFPADPLPDNGLGRFADPRGPGGPQVFRFQFRRDGGFLMDDDDPPPSPPPPAPPPPGPRGFD